MCKLHRAAWAANLDYVRPLCMRIAPPRSDRRRARGDRAAVDYTKERKRELDAVGVHTKNEHSAAALFSHSAHSAWRAFLMADGGSRSGTATWYLAWPWSTRGGR